MKWKMRSTRHVGNLNSYFEVQGSPKKACCGGVQGATLARVWGLGR